MLPVLEATQDVLRLLYDRRIRHRSGYCSQSIGDVLGYRLGDANRSHDRLLQAGWTPRPKGQVRPGDVVVYNRFGRRGAGARYGHIGFAARLGGKWVLASNLSGDRSKDLISLPQGFIAYAPPQPREIVNVQHSARMVRMGVNAGRDRLTRGARRLINNVGHEATRWVDRARRGVQAVRGGADQIADAIEQQTQYLGQQAAQTAQQVYGPVAGMWDEFTEQGLPEIGKLLNQVTAAGPAPGIGAPTTMYAPPQSLPAPDVQKLAVSGMAPLRPLSYVSNVLGEKQQEGAQDVDALDVWRRTLQPNLYGQPNTFSGNWGRRVESAFGGGTSGLVAGQTAALGGIAVETALDPSTWLSMGVSLYGQAGRRMALKAVPRVVGRVAAQEIEDDAAAKIVASSVAKQLTGLIRETAKESAFEPRHLGLQVPETVADFSDVIRHTIRITNGVEPERVDQVANRMLSELSHEFSDGMRVRNPLAGEDWHRVRRPGFRAPEVGRTPASYERNITKSVAERQQIDDILGEHIPDFTPDAYRPRAEKFKQARLESMAQRRQGLLDDAARHGELLQELTAQQEALDRPVREAVSQARSGRQSAEERALQRLVEQGPDAETLLPPPVLPRIGEDLTPSQLRRSVLGLRRLVHGVADEGEDVGLRGLVLREVQQIRAQMRSLPKGSPERQALREELQRASALLWRRGAAVSELQAEADDLVRGAREAGDVGDMLPEEASDQLDQWHEAELMQRIEYAQTEKDMMLRAARQRVAEDPQQLAAAREGLDAAYDMHLAELKEELEDLRSVMAEKERPNGQQLPLDEALSQRRQQRKTSKQSLVREGQRYLEQARVAWGFLSERQQAALRAQYADVIGFDPEVRSADAVLRGAESALSDHVRAQDKAMGRLRRLARNLPRDNVDAAIERIEEVAASHGLTVPPALPAGLRKSARDWATAQASNMEKAIADHGERDYAEAFAAMERRAFMKTMMRRMPAKTSGRLKHFGKLWTATSHAEELDVEPIRHITRKIDGSVDRYMWETLRHFRGYSPEERSTIHGLFERLYDAVVRSSEAGIEPGKVIAADSADTLSYLLGRTRGEVPDLSAYIDDAGNIVEAMLTPREQRLLKTARGGSDMMRRLWDEFKGEINLVMAKMGRGDVGDLRPGYWPRILDDTPEAEALRVVRGGQGVELDTAHEVNPIRYADWRSAEYGRPSEAMDAQLVKGVPVEEAFTFINDPLESGTAYLHQLKHTLKLGEWYKLVESRFPTATELGEEEFARRWRAGWRPLAREFRDGTREALPGLEERLVYPGLQREFERRIGFGGKLEKWLSTWRNYLLPLKLPLLLTARMVLTNIMEQGFNASMAGLHRHPVAALKGLYWANRVIAQEAVDQFVHVDPVSWADKLSNRSGKMFTKVLKAIAPHASDEKLKLYQDLIRQYNLQSGYGATSIKELQLTGHRFTDAVGKVSRAGGKVMDAASDLTDSAARVVFGFDDVGRKAMFISLLEAGESPEAARRIVSEVAVEYGPEMMADVDEILRVLSWFYRYNRHRTQQFVEHAARSPQAAVATTKIIQKNAEAMGYDDETALLLEGRGWLKSNPEWMPVNYSLPGLNGLRPTKEQFRRDGPSVPFIRVRVPALEGVGEVARRVVTAPGREFMESLPPPVYAVNLYLESLQQQAQGKLDEAEATQRNALEKLPIIGGYARTIDQFTPEEALPVVGYAGSPRPAREALRRAEKSGHLSPQLIDADSSRLRAQRKLYALGLQATWVNLRECLQGLTVLQLKRLLEISKQPGDHYFMPGEIMRELKAREGVRTRQPGVKKWDTEPKGPRTALQQWRDEGSRDGRQRPQRTHSW